MPRAARPKPIPADQLPADFVARLVGVVRDNMRTIELASRELRKRAELAAAEDLVPGLDRNMTASLRDLASTMAELIAAYPGLLELANGDRGLGDDSAIGGSAAEERLREALAAVER